MEMIYNELSNIPVSENKILANQRVAFLIECYKKGQQNGFDRIRFPKQFHEIEISGGYTLQQWLDETDQRNYKDLILGARTYPFIKTEDTWAEEEYIKHHFYFENADNNIIRTECLGLAAAHIYDTLAVSFRGNPVWEKDLFSIKKVNDVTGLMENADVTNVFSSDCFQKQNVRTFIERISEIVLQSSPLNPDDKVIRFRSDHGIDVLNAFAKRITKSPYVNGIINSLPFNNGSKSFIRRVYPNGLIEVVLYWTDRGLGMVIQTTGRNLRETEEIAKLLETEYT